MDCCVVGDVVLSIHPCLGRWYVRMIDPYGCQEIFFGSRTACRSFVSMLHRMLLDAAGNMET